MDQLTNFQKNALLNSVAGNEACGGWAALEHQLELIQDELNEMRLGIQTRDVQEVRDGIADVLVTTYGMGHRLGIDADVDHDAVFVSNMSKFDRTFEDAMLTVDKYLKLNVQTVIINTKVRLPSGEDAEYFVVRSELNQQGSDGKSYPKNKFLKSYNYQEPVFSALPPPVASSLTE